MKRQLFTFLMVLSSLGASAQTRAHRNHLSAGFGFQQYNGDLGNTFYDTDEEWYGVARVSLSRYLNASFDLLASATVGDYGHCNDDEVNNPGALNMRSRLNLFSASLKYKFANGYLLKEDARLSPYVYLGGGYAWIKDIWATGDRVNNGSYSTFNAGLGLSYHLASNFDIGLNIGLGYFSSDKLDFISKGNSDMVLQHTFSVGYSF